MEIILAIVVASAVIFFGALISIGSERQRRAIDGLREQVVLWAMQDLRIKRERFSHEIKINDPVAWLNKMLGKVCNFDSDFQIIESFDGPLALACMSTNGNERVILSPLSPAALHQMKCARQNRLSKYADRNPLLAQHRKLSIFEISVLNGGLIFDLELPIVWNALTGQNVDQMERIWVYRLM